MSVNYQRIDRLKRDIREQGLLYVGQDLWPYDEFHILILGSEHTDLDADQLAEDLGKLGISAVALPKRSAQPNLYYFLTYKAEPTAQIYDATLDKYVNAEMTVDLIEYMFDSEPYKIVLAAVYIELIDISSVEILSEVQAFIYSAEDFVELSNSVEAPILISDTEALTPNAWVWMRVRFQGMQPVGLSAMREELEARGYGVINPVAGISGFFESVFNAADYRTVDTLTMPFNPHDAEGVTQRTLQDMLSSVYGLHEGLPRAQVSLFTTVETITDQEQLDNFYWFQQSEEAVSGTAAAGVDAVRGTLDILQSLLKTVPVFIWLALGGLGAYGAWEGYKYIQRERGKR